MWYIQRPKKIKFDHNDIMKRRKQIRKKKSAEKYIGLNCIHTLRIMPERNNKIIRRKLLKTPMCGLNGGIKRKNTATKYVYITFYEYFAIN